MKRIFLFILGLTVSFLSYADPVEIPLQGCTEPDIVQLPHKAPIRPLVISLDEHVLTLPALGDDFTLELRDANDAVVYMCYVPAGTTQAVLPVTLSGTYEIRLVATTCYYIGYLNL